MPQIRLRLHTADFRGFDETIEKRSDVEAAPRARAVVILATEDHTAEAALGSIVVERNARVVEKACQPAPQPEQIPDRFAEATLWQRALRQRPRLNLADDRARTLVAQPTALRQEFVSHHLARAAHRRKRCRPTAGPSPVSACDWRTRRNRPPA